jgi:FkbM family methyltransferase
LRIVRQLLKKKVRGRLQRRLRRIRQLLRSMRRPDKAVGAAIRNNHMTPTIAAGARLSRWFLYYYWNEQNWTMHSNGEMLLLRTLAAHWSSSPSITVFDVGANKGSYTKLVRKTMPNSVVHCFEIIPRTRDSLTANLSGIEDVVISAYGLSNAETHLEVGFNYDDDSRARVTSTLLKMNEVIACKVQTGDQYLAERNIEAVDLLKIDTEGHEIAVLEGFRSALQEAKIRVIQFEYGTTWFASRHFLHEAYALLEPAGFYIGRLYPDGVFFKPYDRLWDDHFRMGNYVAVHRTCVPLIVALNLNGPMGRG